MKRTSFLSGAIGLAAGGALLGNRAMAQEAGTDLCQKKLAAKNRFLKGWLDSWLQNLKGRMPEPEKVALIEANGRACAARAGLLEWAASFHGDVDKFLAEMEKHIGPGNARRDGQTIHLVYEKCFCPLVGDMDDPLPGDYCLCTRGWTQAVYGALAGKPVRVDLKASVKRGDPKCLIEVELG